MVIIPSADKAVALQFELEPADVFRKRQVHVGDDDVQAPPQAVARIDRQVVALFRHGAAVSEPAEDRIARDDGGGHAQRAAVAQVDLAVVPPRAARHRHAAGIARAHPRAADLGRHELPARGAVVLRARIPETVIGFRPAGVHQAPGAEVRRITELQPVGGLGGEVERVVEHAPAAHGGHVADAAIGAERVEGRVEPAAHHQARRQLPVHESARVLPPHEGVRIPFLELEVEPQVLVGLHVVRRAVLGESIGRLERRAVKSVLGAERIEVVIDEVLDLLLPLVAQPGGLLGKAFLLERVDQLEHDELVVEAPLVGVVVLRIDLVGIDIKGAGRFPGAVEIAGGVEVLRHLGVHLGDLVHVEVEHDHVRVVVGAPDMLLGQIAQRRRAGGELLGVGLAPRRVAVDVPVRRAVDAVRIGALVVAALQPSPDEVLQVILQRLDLLRVGEGDVLRCQIRRFAEARIVAGQSVDHAVQEDVRVVDGPGDLRLHVVWPVDSVPPLRRVLDLLLVDDEGRALLDQGFHRLGDEKFEIGLAPAVVPDRQHVLAELPEGHFVDVVVGFGRAEGLDRRLIGELGLDCLDLGLGVQRKACRQILRDRHARHDADVEEPRLVNHLAQFLVAVGPLHAEAVGGLAAGPAGRGQVQSGMGLAPGAALLRAAAAARMDIDLRAAAAAAAARILELGSGADRHQQERRGARGAHEVEERPVAGDELVPEESALEYLDRVFTRRAGRGDADAEVADLPPAFCRSIPCRRSSRARSPSVL